MDAQTEVPDTIDLTDPEDIQLAQNEIPPEESKDDEPPIEIGIPIPTDWLDTDHRDVQDPVHPVFEDEVTELLHWHYRLGHLSFPRLRQMAKLGIIPKHLAEAPSTTCSSCKHGRAKRRPSSRFSDCRGT
jgi:hypothetical protein